MKLIIGLGNPGAEYEGTRHNYGFVAVEYLADCFKAKWKNKSKLSAEISEMLIDDEKVLLVKPTTFYNLSGDAVRALCDYYDLANENILVIHDDMTLLIGTLRMRIGGEAAGNNGIKNLIDSVGEDFARLRIGSAVGQNSHGCTLPDRSLRDFVLSKPTKSENETFKKLLPEIEKVVREFVRGNFTETSVSV